jgi:hypothetical protein
MDMFDNLYRVMKNYSAYPMLLASDVVRPGILLETSWDFFGLGTAPTKFISEEGCPWKLLGIKDEPAFYQKYPTDLRNASIVTGEITGKVKFGGNLALPQFGFSADASFGKEEVVKFRVSGITVMSFKVGFDQYILRRELRDMKKAKPEWFGWVDDDFLVTDSYYISGLEYEFKEESKTDVKATCDKLKGGVSVGFILETEGTAKLKLVGTSETPFAVRGIKV